MQLEFKGYGIFKPKIKEMWDIQPPFPPPLMSGASLLIAAKPTLIDLLRKKLIFILDTITQLNLAECPVARR